MKIILSRKGFDSSNGGIPSPIMPDGTLLSMPIPAKEKMLYKDIVWNGQKYSDILRDLCPTGKYDKYNGKCHLDPDIRDNRIKHIDGWQPIFGQCGAAQGQLRNAKVEKDDIFLFFGWFRQVEETTEGYRFKKRNLEDFYSGNDLQVIYGYMQVKDIITDPKLIKEYSWHPHSSKIHLQDSNNALYLPSDKLSINPLLNGYGTLDFRKDRVLTMEGMGRATWNEYSFLMPEYVYGDKKNSAKEKGLYYAGIWQELIIINEPTGLKDWVNQILS